MSLEDKIQDFCALVNTQDKKKMPHTCFSGFRADYRLTWIRKTNDGEFVLEMAESDSKIEIDKLYGVMITRIDVSDIHLFKYKWWGS